MLKEGNQVLFAYTGLLSPLFLVLKTRTTWEKVSAFQVQDTEFSGVGLSSPAQQSYSSDAHGTWIPGLRGSPVATEIEVHSLGAVALALLCRTLRGAGISSAHPSPGGPQGLTAGRD